MLKILHITNWYPSLQSPVHSTWIRNHIRALSCFTKNHIFHIEIRKGEFRVLKGINKDFSRFIIIRIPFEVWKIYEILSFILILWLLIKNCRKKFDLINFHIAYPNCTYVHIIKKLFKCPILITEHWSGYHFNFNIQNSIKRKRIQKIFQQNTPVMAVSNALLTDIRNFSKAEFPGYVVPNVVDTSVFRFPANQVTRGMSFFMVSQWKWPKDPFTIVKAWNNMIKAYPEAELIIGGYGPQYDELPRLIEQLHLEEKVSLIGQLTPKQIAIEMQQAKAFIHCSDYETFSVVCAEALCCGTPVIASRVGGIPEYIQEGDGFLVPENTPGSFVRHIMKFLDEEEFFDRKTISRKMINKFAERKVGKLYHSVITEIISNWN